MAVSSDALLFAMGPNHARGIPVAIFSTTYKCCSYGGTIWGEETHYGKYA